MQLWAVRSLLKHKNDFRPVLFSRKELENANTSDIIWNAAQKELVQTGKIHGYLRMYWAKMLLQWTETPMDAIDTAIYLMINMPLTRLLQTGMLEFYGR